MIFLTSLFKILDKTLSKEKVNLLTNSSVSSPHLNSEHLAYVMRRTNRNCNIPTPPPCANPCQIGSFKFPLPRAKIVFKMPYPVVRLCLPLLKNNHRSLVPIRLSVIELVYICGTQRYLVKMESYLRRWLGGTWYALRTRNIS